MKKSLVLFIFMVLVISGCGANRGSKEEAAYVVSKLEKDIKILEILEVANAISLTNTVIITESDKISLSKASFIVIYQSSESNSAYSETIKLTLLSDGRPPKVVGTILLVRR
jgi:hypothetical protein